MQEQDTQTRKQRQDLGVRRLFRTLIKERRGYRKGSLEHQWRTKAATAYLQMMRNVPVNEWENYV